MHNQLIQLRLIIRRNFVPQHSERDDERGSADPWSLGTEVDSCPPRGGGIVQAFSRTRPSRSAFPITDTDERLIASAAMMGESSMPDRGYSTPAATGTPAAL